MDDLKSKDFCYIQRDKRCPKSADFSVCIHGDLMSPLIKDNTVVYISRKTGLKEFEVGLFLYRGEILCRQWCEDYAGTVHLLCANPARQEYNVSVCREDVRRLRCLGKVMLGKTPPRPIYL